VIRDTHTKQQARTTSYRRKTAGLAFYIYVKGVNSSKKRLDMANSARSTPTNEGIRRTAWETKSYSRDSDDCETGSLDGTPLRRRGGAGISTGSSADTLSTTSAQSAPESHFLQQPPVTPQTAPLTLAQYRAAVNAKRTGESNREHFSTPHNA